MFPDGNGTTLIVRIFKIDTEFNGRGTASFTLEGIKQFTEVRKSPEVNEHVVATIRNLVTAVISD
jgi:hypothetical protein